LVVGVSFDIGYYFIMKFRWPVAFVFSLAFYGLGGVVLLAASADTPYQAIVARNVFGLVPIPVAPPPQSTKPNDASLPKITPNGIMTIFGKLQVLFKVSEPGKAASQEDSYIMSEGDRQDDIVVQKIDEKSATITFNNHGTIQELALVAGKASSGAPGPAASPSPVGIPLPRPGMPAPAGAGGQTVTTIGSRFGRGGPGGNNPNAGGGPAGAGLGQNGNSTTPKMTPEEQVLMIEANRLKAIEDNNPVANLLPTTPLTSQTLGQDGGDSGDGAPAPTPGQ
jgi:hypothetical protein